MKGRGLRRRCHGRRPRRMRRARGGRCRLECTRGRTRFRCRRRRCGLRLLRCWRRRPRLWFTERRTLRSVHCSRSRLCGLCLEVFGRLRCKLELIVDLIHEPSQFEVAREGRRCLRRCSDRGCGPLFDARARAWPALTGPGLRDGLATGLILLFLCLLGQLDLCPLDNAHLKLRRWWRRRRRLLFHRSCRRRRARSGLGGRSLVDSRDT